MYLSLWCQLGSRGAVGIKKHMKQEIDGGDDGDGEQKTSLVASSMTLTRTYQSLLVDSEMGVCLAEDVLTLSILDGWKDKG